MKRHFSSVAAAILIASVAFSQGQDGLKKRTHALVTTTPGVVTEAEAVATFDRVAGIFRNVFHVSGPARLDGKSSIAPITRSEIIEEFAKLYKYAEPAFRITPKAVPVDQARLRVDKPSVRSDLVKLVERGCIAKYGVLATGSVKTVGVVDFGDAVGFFISRIGEMTHTPSTKWSPYLHG